MALFWFIIYNAIVLPVFFLVTHVLALFSKKIRGAVIERYKILNRLVAYKKVYGRRTVVFHAASMGEFEHIKPVISRFKETFPNSTVIVTFFSPSGYNNVKSYPGVNHFFYLPFDFPFMLRKFFKKLDADAFIIAKYDLWPNAIWTASKLEIPIFLINATLGEASKRHKGLVFLFNKEVYKHVKEIFLSSDKDEERFKKLANHENIWISGDTKFDQVLWRKENAKRNKIIDDKVIHEKRVFIAGSIWPEDWNVIIPVFNILLKKYPDLIVFLVPHETTDSHIEEIKSLLEHPFIKYSQIEKYTNEKFIVVNRIGVLASLYSRGHFAYVGGSFKQNVHNVMEPAVFGIPVFYGPVHKNSFEAIELNDLGGSIVVEDSQEFEKQCELIFNSKEAQKKYADIAHQYVHNNCGATEIIVDRLTEYLS